MCYTYVRKIFENLQSLSKTLKTNVFAIQPAKVSVINMYIMTRSGVRSIDTERTLSVQPAFPPPQKDQLLSVTTEKLLGRGQSGTSCYYN